MMNSKHTSASKIVLHIPLDSLVQSPTTPVLDITASSTIGRFRLIDCTQYIHHNALAIHEFSDFPVADCPYTAISYVWRGNSVDGCEVGPKFTVAGAEDGDPVSVNVLRHACTATLRQGVNYVWLDRLCIMQTSKDDKQWQIGHMFRIYQGSTVSLVFPGGIQRLVRLDEPTTWINRGWTLQEALAPPRVEVVFSWKYGSGMYYGRFRGNLTELISTESAITPLRDVLSLNAFGTTNFYPTSTPNYTTFRTTIFGVPTDPSSNVRSEQTTEVVIFMLKSALQHGMITLDELAPTIWRSALFRASSRPVDMVFSIMGLFGVTLDTRKFHKDDRLGATVALMQEILRQGGRASWLGLAPYLPPHPQLSTFPIFPSTRVDGQVLLELESRDDNEWSDRIASKQRSAILDVRRIEMPMGSMDDAGYLIISRKAIRIYPEPNLKETQEDHSAHLSRWAVLPPPQCCLEHWAINRTGWRFYSNQDDQVQGSRRTLAVLLGWYNEFSLDGVWSHPRYLSALLIREHEPDRFHVESFFELNSRLEFWIDTWEEYTLHIGGPKSIQAIPLS